MRRDQRSWKRMKGRAELCNLVTEEVEKGSGKKRRGRRGRKRRRSFTRKERVKRGPQFFWLVGGERDKSGVPIS